MIDCDHTQCGAEADQVVRFSTGDDIRRYCEDCLDDLSGFEYLQYEVVRTL